MRNKQLTGRWLRNENLTHVQIEHPLASAVFAAPLNRCNGEINLKFFRAAVR
jgi:hypothetical protein